MIKNIINLDLKEHFKIYHAIKYVLDSGYTIYKQGKKLLNFEFADGCENYEISIVKKKKNKK